MVAATTSPCLGSSRAPLALTFDDLASLLCLDANRLAVLVNRAQVSPERSLPQCPPLQAPGARGQSFTDHLQPRLSLPLVNLGMEMPQHLSLAANEHQPAGNRAFPCVSSAQIATRDLGQQ